MQTAFHDLAASDFPFTIEYLAEDTGEVLESLTVDGPGSIRVPTFGRKVSVRLTHSSGKRTLTRSDGTTLKEDL